MTGKASLVKNTLAYSTKTSQRKKFWSVGCLVKMIGAKSLSQGAKEPKLYSGEFNAGKHANLFKTRQLISVKLKK